MTDKVKNIVSTLSFLLIIVSMLVINITKKDSSISFSERRKLQQFPNFSIHTVFNGSFFKDFENYTMDQFVKREEFRKLKTKIEVGLFKKQDYENIYVYNSKLIDNLYPLNEKSIYNVISKMNYLRDNYLHQSSNIYYTIIPDKNYYVNENNLKIDYNRLKELMNNGLTWAKYIEICDCLELESYYATDSHWRQEKLIKVANKILQSMNMPMQTNYNKKTITNFKGVYSGQFPAVDFEDTISILTNDVLERCSVYNFESKSCMPIYDLGKINSFDKYDIYLSGASSLLIIDNPSSNNNKELIVFRDSFASSLIPLIINDYSKITIIDTRYISPKILDRYVNFKGKDVLFAYSTILINNSYSLK